MEKNIGTSSQKEIKKTLFSANFCLMCIANLFTCMAIYSVMPVLPLYLIDVLHCKNSIMGICLAVFPLVALAAPKMLVRGNLAVKTVGLPGNGDAADFANLHKGIQVTIHSPKTEARAFGPQ